MDSTFFRKILVFVLACCCLTPAFAQNYNDQKRLAAGIEQILQTYAPDVNVGMKVVDLNKNQVLYSRNAKRSFLPASNQKIFTATAALSHLGPGYKFATQALTNVGEPNEGEIKGNLYIKFSGAPDLKTKHLNQLMQDIKKAGIDRINGDVIIDTSAFDNETTGPGWMTDDTEYCFSAPVSANIINQNCLQFHIKPGSKVGEPLAVKPNYTNRFVELKNTTMTKAKDKKGCDIKVIPGDSKNYVVEGCLPIERNGVGLTIAMSTPDNYTKRAIKQLAEQNHIKVAGQYRIAKAPRNVKEIAKVESQPLNELVVTMLKESDNLISDSLFKTLGNHYFDKPGTWKSGSKAVQTILTKKFDMNFDDVVMVDGSGLSRYNLISPNHIVALLVNIYRDDTLAANFINALPVGGVDGTLEYRLKKPDLEKRVYAKTGAMSGVTTLAGYITTKRNKKLAFSIMMNGMTGDVDKYKQIEDLICQYLIQNY